MPWVCAKSWMTVRSICMPKIIRETRMDCTFHAGFGSVRLKYNQITG